MGLPIPNLDDRRFDELVDELRALIPLYSKEWSDHNVHDPGVTFMELFAWLAEMQMYQLNYLTDAQKRKFLQLADILPKSAQPAQVDVTFPDVQTELLLNEGDQIIASIQGEAFIFEASEYCLLITAKLCKILTVTEDRTIDQTKANETEGVCFSPFTEKAPAAAQLRLGFDVPLPKEKKLQLYFEIFQAEDFITPKVENIASHFFPPVALQFEYFDGSSWQPLENVIDQTGALSFSGYVSFEIPEEMGLGADNLYWIRIHLSDGRYEIPPLIERITLNTVPARQIETIRNELLGEGAGEPEQSVFLSNAPLMANSLMIQVESEAGQWEDWQEVRDFEWSAPDDRHYILDGQKGEIQFGNGLNGKIPAKGLSIRAAEYKITRGSEGNLAAGLTWTINKTNGCADQGVNYQSARDGADAESIEQAQYRAAQELKYRQRAVTSEDYERLTLQTPGIRIARAKTLPNYHAEFPCLSVPGSVTVVALPKSSGQTPPVPSAGFLKTVFTHLQPMRLLAADLHVIGPQYFVVSVSCQMHLQERYSSSAVKDRVQKKLAEFLNPYCGGEDGTGWPFGRAVYPSELYQIIEGVEGVDYVRNIQITVNGRAYSIDETAPISSIGLAISGEHRIETI